MSGSGQMYLVSFHLLKKGGGAAELRSAISCSYLTFLSACCYSSVS